MVRVRFGFYFYQSIGLKTMTQYSTVQSVDM